jgi:hypothetical protein
MKRAEKSMPVTLSKCRASSKAGAAGGAAQIKSALCAGFPAHGRNGQSGERPRKVGHAEILVAVMEFGVFGQQAVGFVVRSRTLRRRLATM